MSTTNRTYDILLVEDNPADADLFVEAAADCGFTINTRIAADGESSLTMVRHPQSGRLPSLIILDLNLPRKNGLEVLSELKANSDYQPIPVLVLSTSGSERDITACYIRQANAYIKKPVDFDRYCDLLKRITQFWFVTVSLPHEVAHA